MTDSIKKGKTAANTGKNKPDIKQEIKPTTEIQESDSFEQLEQAVILSSNKHEDKDTEKAVTIAKENNLVGENFMNFTSYSDVVEMATSLARSSMSGNMTKEDAILAFVKAKELGIGWSSALSHMHNINGKTGVDYHILLAKALQPSANLTWNVIKENEPIYIYIGRIGNDPNKDLFSVETIDELPENYVILKPYEDADDAAKYREAGKFPISRKRKVAFEYTIGDVTHQLLDSETLIEFTRKIYRKNGQVDTIKAYGYFNNTLGVTAGVFLKKDGTVNTTGPWVRYNFHQQFVRAWTFGFRKSGMDLGMGVYETSELFDMNHVDYEIIDGTPIRTDR